MHAFKLEITPARTIAAGFALVIILGAVLLRLPFCLRPGVTLSFIDSLYTATSAVCVTGLVVTDTGSTFSPMGEALIALLIQIGGLGVAAVGTGVMAAFNQKLNFKSRYLIRDSFNLNTMGGIIRFLKSLLMATLVIELLGAAILLPIFLKDFGTLRGVWYALFHSISAFCNAGFDLMGVIAPFSSLTSYSDHPIVSIVIMLLIITGGIGFLTWDDIRTNRFHFRKYRMQSKVILTVTLALIAIPSVYFFLFEFVQAPLDERLLLSLFQSVTPRTAGFNTADLTAMSEPGQFIMTVLMLVGGSPGSTAGGMKTTTLAVLLASSLAVFRRKESANFFNRRISNDAVRQAATILIMYLFLFLTAGLIISRMENLPLLDCLFETASAIGTVGLSLNITPRLGVVSHLILISLMFFGRVGGLTLIFATMSHTQPTNAKLPQERITVG